MARHLDLDGEKDYEGDCTPKAQYNLGLNKHAVEELLFYRSLFAPFISMYQRVILELKTLVDVDYVPVAQFVEKFGSIKKRDIKRVLIILDRFESMHIIDMAPTEFEGKGNVEVLWLTEEWNGKKVLDRLSNHIYNYFSW